MVSIRLLLERRHLPEMLAYVCICLLWKGIYIYMPPSIRSYGPSATVRSHRISVSRVARSYLPTSGVALRARKIGERAYHGANHIGLGDSSQVAIAIDLVA